LKSLLALLRKRIKKLQAGLTRSGVKGFWQASLEDYRRAAKTGYAPPVLVAGVCMRLGDKACALEWLEKGYEERDDLMIDLNVDPVFDGLRSEPRFQELVRPVGLPRFPSNFRPIKGRIKWRVWLVSDTSSGI
jgi:hypothetical protein